MKNIIRKIIKFLFKIAAIIMYRPKIIGKLLQGIFAAFYTYMFLNTFCFLNLDL